MYETIVIGGGPAGLQAALTLGRMHRRTLLIDSGEYRNGTVAHAQNLLTHDGRAPADLRALGRADLAGYATVEVRDAAVRSVAPVDDGFSIDLGSETVASHTLVLATGLRDELPDIPGLEAGWGREVANCPFCHGHEFSGSRVAILGSGEHPAMMAAMLRPIVSETVVIAPDAVRSVAPAEGGLTLHLQDGSSIDVGGVFVAPISSQRAPFAEQLDLRMLPSGCVEVDLIGQTSVAGVFAAGDMAHVPELPGPMATLAAAINAGQLAAVGCVRMFVGRELAEDAG